jgi:hypothetical protein
MEITPNRRILIQQIVAWAWESGGVRSPQAAEEIKAMMAEPEMQGLQMIPKAKEAK